MPIKIKKFDIEYSTEIPEPGYMFLGFNDAGELVQKDENGETRNVVSSMSGTTFDSIITPYLTVGGTRVSGYPWGSYTIAQGTSNTCIGDTSFVRGRHSQSTGDYSYASGLYVVSSGQSSYAWGVGLGTSQMLKSIGVNSFVHEYAISDTAGTLSDFSVILGGYDQSIGSASDCSVILGGHENLIESSVPNSFIIGGYDNIIPTGKNNVIYLGRTEFSEPIFDNTVYMTKLSLDISPGNFVTGSTSEYNGLIWYDNSGSHNIYAIVNGEKKTLVQASGNFVYTDTDQTITGSKTFSNTTIFTTSNIISNVSLQFSTTNKGIITSDGTGTGNGFDTFIRTGSGSTTGKGGNITIQTGTGGNVSSGTAGNGGDLTISSGTGGISSSGGGTQGKGGNLILSAGNGGLYGSTYGIGGTVTISGGTGSSVSGNVEIYGGGSNDGKSGDIILKTLPNSTMSSGDIYIKTSDSYYSGGDIILTPGIGASHNGSVFIGSGSPNNRYLLEVNSNAKLGVDALCAGGTNEIWSGSDNNNTADFFINHRGYHEGFTQYRNLRISNGKGSVMASFMGSTNKITFNTPLSANNVGYLSSNGYMYMTEQNMLFVWGTYLSSSDDSQTFSFNYTFPTNCLFFITDLPANGSSYDRFGFTVNRLDVVDGSQYYHYFAIGY